MTNTLSQNIQNWFELQQRYVEEGQDMVDETMREALEIQSDTLRAVGNAVATQQKAQETATELGREVTEGYLDALETSLDEWESSVEEARTAADRSIEDLQKIQEQANDSVQNEVSDALQTYNEFATAYVDLVNSAVHTSLSTVGPATEAGEQIQVTVEEQTQAATQAVEETQEIVKDIEISDDAEIEDVNGIGPTYAERLRDSGITSVRDLAVSTPDEIAEAADVGVDRAHDWIKQASEK